MGSEVEVLLELVECEIARPIEGAVPDEWIFDADSAHWIQRAVRLQRDLEIDWVAVAMLVDLLRERERLRVENRALRRRLDRFLAGAD